MQSEGKLCEHSSTVFSRRMLLGACAALSSGLAVRRGRAQSSVDAVASVARSELESLAKWAEAERARVSAIVLDVATGRELAAIFPRESLNPASNQKILTIAAALDQLGPAHRFLTTLHGRGSQETLAELVLRGTGDPELSTATLDGLARSLAARGIRRISGDLLVDQSAFDNHWDPPAYEQRPDEWAAYRAPVSAVAIDGNTVTLHVAPTTENTLAKVWFEPPGLVEVTGHIDTVIKGGRQSVGFSVAAKGELLAARISGTIPAARTAVSFARRIAAPEVAPGRVLASLLEARGIRVEGAIKAGGAGMQSELAHASSRALAEIVPALGKHSDNFVAEMLLKTLGAKRGGAVGNSKAGAEAVASYMGRLGALEAGTRIVNGSGLYEGNRVSAFSLATVLAAAHSDPRIGPELLASLAIGGVDGTLISRFRALRERRTIRAKSGTLANVVALSGYILRLSKDGPLAFSVLLNAVGGRQAEARRRIDGLVEAIAQAT